MKERTMRTLGLGAGVALTVAAIVPALAVAQDVPEGALTELGAGEGEVNVVAWPGYVEDGSNDPAIDWVTSFEEATGCQVNVTLGNTSDEMFTLMQSGNFDVVSASGDASNRLIASGEVAPINLALISNYVDVFEGLKSGHPGAGFLGHRVRPGVPVRRQDHRVRQPDLHRRRRRLPDGDQP